jgi:hypothetical protein
MAVVLGANFEGEDRMPQAMGFYSMKSSMQTKPSSTWLNSTLAVAMHFPFLIRTHRFPTSTSDVRILKPHGSLNWLVPFEDNYKFRDDDPLLILDSQNTISYCREFAVLHIANTRRLSEIAFDAGLLIMPPQDEESAPVAAPQLLTSVEDQAMPRSGTRMKSSSLAGACHQLEERWSNESRLTSTSPDWRMTRVAIARRA